MGKAFEEGFEQLFLYELPGDITFPGLVAEPGVKPATTAECFAIGASMWNWWLVSLNRDAFGLVLAEVVVLWLRHALGQAGAREKRAVETILVATRPRGGSEDSSEDEAADTDTSWGYTPPHTSRHGEEGWPLGAVESVNEMDAEGPQHHLLVLGMELGGPLRAVVAAGAVLGATELVWPSMVSNAARFVFEQPLLLVLALSHRVVFAVWSPHSASPKRHTWRQCVVALTVGFLLLPAAHVLLLGQGKPGMHDVVIVDWIGFISIFVAVFEVVENERVFTWTALIGLLLASRTSFGARGIIASLGRASPEGLWWGTTVSMISTVYAVPLLAFMLGPTMVLELALLGWLSRVVVKTRNDLPRPVYTFCLAVDSFASSVFQPDDRDSTAIEDITSNGDTAEMCEVSMILAGLGLFASPFIFGSMAGAAGMRDPLRTSWLPASSILM